MSKQPSLNVYRPVVGIDPLQLRRLKGRLNLSGQFDNADVRRVVRRADKLQAGILLPAELRKLYHSLGRQVTRSEIRDLKDSIREGLGSRANGTIESVPLLPSTIYSPKRNRNVLAVAASADVAIEREITQNAVRVALGLSRVPENVWFDDGYVTSVYLAHSTTKARVRVLEHLDDLLNRKERPLFEEEILPVEVQLAPIKFDELY